MIQAKNQFAYLIFADAAYLNVNMKYKYLCPFSTSSQFITLAKYHVIDLCNIMIIQWHKATIVRVKWADIIGLLLRQ